MRAARTPAEELDRQTDAAVFGIAPLDSIASRFASRAALFQFYASAVSQSYPPVKNGTCSICQSKEPIKGFFALEWRGTARVYWLKIILFSSVFLPVLVLHLLLPVSIIPHFNPKFGEEVSLRTYHCVCRDCWARFRVRQFAAIAAAVAFGLALALSFITAAISGSIAIASLGSWLGFKPRVAAEPGLIFLGTLFLCILSKFVLSRIPGWILVPAHLDSICKRPFQLMDGKLIKAE